MIDPKKVTVTIPGLKNTYTFLHISDAHLAYAYPEESEYDKKMAADQAVRWTEALVPPNEAFDDMTVYAKEIGADALMVAGDCADYISEGTVRYIKEKALASGVEMLYVYGNHEGSRYDKKTDQRSYYPMYASLMQGDPSFWVKDYGEMLIVGVDDSDKKITAEQIEKLKEQIARNIPIILLVHIPLRTEAIEEPVMKKWGTSFMLGTDDDTELTKEFCKLVKAEKSNIKAIVAGHIHFAHEGEFAPNRMQYVSAPAYNHFARIITVKGE